MPLRATWSLAKCAAAHWATDRAATIGAALAFYCAFSLAPLLIILVTVTGWIVGAELAQHQLEDQLTGPVRQRDRGRADDRDAQLANRRRHGRGGRQRRDAAGRRDDGLLRAGSRPPGDLGRARAGAAGIHGWIRSRVLSFGLILAVGFLLLVSLSVSTALSALRRLSRRSATASSSRSPPCWTSSSRWR